MKLQYNDFIRFGAHQHSFEMLKCPGRIRVARSWNQKWMMSLYLQGRSDLNGAVRYLWLHSPRANL